MTPRRRGLGLAALVAVLVLAGGVATSCSPAGRYRVLSAVFDGVPPPPGMVVEGMDELDLDPNASAFSQGLATMRARRGPIAKPVKMVSVHKPVAENRCNECHNMDHPGADLARDATLCDKCHLEERQAKGWDHGPINLGTCIPCHLPHESPHEHLLAVAMPALCLNCHEAVSAEGPDYHRVANFGACTACHDPHRMY